MSDFVSKLELDGREPSSWMREAISRRLDRAAATTAGLHMPFGIVLLNLSDADNVYEEIEDRTCDRCRTYIPQGSVFYSGLYDVTPAALRPPWPTLLTGHQVLVGIGLCDTCARLEAGEAEDDA